MLLFFPRVVTMDISLAVTLTDSDAHCERLKGTADAICMSAMDPSSGTGRKSERQRTVKAAGPDEDVER